ncbi:hypothetical protein KIPE111705_34885 [Kibdelosporangium persicum]|uniref:Antibiotic biosynthesis monooxygenase n=1 Tax=Kibdelosporangium persicum TaxID=2698649 RepID=A0ABX2F0V5_9PSEU|nr:hypothetical protein [Kibdelosporangium persicum]NRN64543.1 hypothetical protein [Kibdelosporangium persicum]
MALLLIQYHVAPNEVSAVTDAVHAAFEAVEAEQPQGIRYAYLRRSGSAEFTALLELADGAENPLPGIEAARRLQAVVAKAAAGPVPSPQAYEILGAYRMFG